MTHIEVRVPCEYRWPSDADSARRCWSQPNEHVHQPPPCANGQDYRHHDYLPPKSVLLDIAGQTKRIRLR